MAWATNGTPKTLTVAGDDMDITNMSSSTFKQFFIHKITSGSSKIAMTFNNSTGNKYAYRFNYNGTEGSPANTQPSIPLQYNHASDDFVVMYLCDKSGEEKLATEWQVDGSSSSAPEKQNMIFKYVPADLTDRVTRIDLYNDGSGGTGDYAVGSNVSALGSDGVESMKVQDGAVFYETDTNKSYVLYNSTWSEL